MQLKKLIDGIALSLVLALSLSVQAYAGPSFNTSREELSKLSGEAGSEFHLGFARFHDMLHFLELRDEKSMATAKEQALEKLDRSMKMFSDITEKTPAQKLIIKPKTKEDELALQSFQRHLEQRKIPFPSSEKELASIAVSTIKDFRSLLAETKLTGTKDDYHRLLALLRAQGFILDIGILSSIVWNITER